LEPFVDSVYWFVATITSTGYGDIKPMTQIEMIYASVWSVGGKILFGYRFGFVAATLANNGSLRVWYEQRVAVCLFCFECELFFDLLVELICNFGEV